MTSACTGGVSFENVQDTSAVKPCLWFNISSSEIMMALTLLHHRIGVREAVRDDAHWGEGSWNGCHSWK
jgi:hypothetical protein